MANRLVKYEVGHGAGVAITTDSGKDLELRNVVIESISSSGNEGTSTAMFGLAADFSGNLFVSDSAQHCIYKITESGFIQLYAGDPGVSGSADGTGIGSAGTAGISRFNNPHGVAVDKSGNVFVADTGNHAIRMIDLNGNVGTVASATVYADVSNPPTTTALTAATHTGTMGKPWGVACAANGDIFVTDKSKHCVYRMRRNRLMEGTADASDAFDAATVIAGNFGNAGDIAAEYANAARFDQPTGIAVDPSGYVFVADSGNNKIKRIGLDGFVVRYCGAHGAGDVIGTYQTSRFTNLGLLACDKSGDLYVIDKVSSGASIGSGTSESSSTVASLSTDHSSVSSESSSTVASLSTQSLSSQSSSYGGQDKIKKIDKNGNTSLISVIKGGHAVGITATPSGVIYMTQSLGT